MKDNWIKSRTVTVTDDYFEFETGREGVIRINFKDILLDEIVQSSCNLKIGVHNFGSCASPELPDALYFLRDRFEQKFINEQIKEFELIAVDFKKSPANHELTEEQRKYFIQGNVMLEAKQPVKMLLLYDKAFTIDPIAYPEGYYNMALIAGAIEKYRYAIFCMKKYLMVVPDTANIQASKDKIYEWEALLSL